MLMPPLSEAASIIACFEGFRSAPYLDSASVPTIGYGTIRYPNGKRVTMEDGPVTEATALALLENDLTATANAVWEHVSRQPTLNQWSAMLSLAYNIGVTAFVQSTVLREFNLGSLPNTGAGFLLWDKAHADGQLVEVPGLLNRRQKERALFLTPDGQPV